MQLKIENMTCGGCAKSVTRVIQSVDPNARIEADLAARSVRIETSVNLSALQQALDEAGYPAAAA